MRTSSAIAATVAVGALLLTGCSSGQPGGASSESPLSENPSGSVKIGYITTRGTDPFAADQVEAARQRAQEMGVEYVSADVKQDASLTINTVNQMIASGVDGIIIAVPDEAVGPQVLKLAADADIPVIASDARIKDADGVEAPFIGLDEVTLGTQAAEVLAGLFEDTAEATAENSAFVTVSQTIATCVARTDTARDVFTEAIGGEVRTIDVPHDGTLQTAVTAMSAAVTSNADVEYWFITSCNDDGVAGAVRALEAAGITKDRTFGMGMDGALACTELAKDSGFYGANYVSFWANGEMAFDSMYDYLVNGTEIPADQKIPGPLVTRENLDEVAQCS